MAAKKSSKKEIICLHGTYHTDDGDLTLYKLPKLPAKGVFKLGHDKLQIKNDYGEGVFPFEFGPDHKKGKFAECDTKVADLDGHYTSREFEYVTPVSADDDQNSLVYNAILSGKWAVYANHDINGQLYFEAQDKDWLQDITVFDNSGKKISLK